MLGAPAPARDHRGAVAGVAAVDRRRPARRRPGIGWQSLVGAELIVVAGGVGYMMVQGQLNVATSIVMAGMIAIGVVGVVIDVALRQVERRLRRNWTKEAP